MKFKDWNNGICVVVIIILKFTLDFKAGFPIVFVCLAWYFLSNAFEKINKTEKMTFKDWNFTICTIVVIACALLKLFFDFEAGACGIF